MSPPITAPTPSVFNVDVVAPPEERQPPPEKKITPPVEIKKPLTDKRVPEIEKKKWPIPQRQTVRPRSLWDRGGWQALKERKMERPAESEEQNKALEEPGKVNGNNNDQASVNEAKEPLPSTEKGTGAPSGTDLFDRKIIEKYASKDTPVQQGLSFDASEFKHRGYMRMLRERIEATWKYPREAAEHGVSGDLILKFAITRKGKLGNVEIVRTSGHSYLDEAAIKALKDAEPYWPLPDDFKKDMLEITGHFIYVFGGAYVM